MQNFKKNLCAVLAGLACIPSSIFATQVTVITQRGENIEVKLDSTEKFSDVMGSLKEYYASEQISDFTSDFNAQFSNPLILTVVVANDQIVVKKKKAWRDYWSSVSKSEKKDLAYVVNTLARDSLISIASSRSSLNKTGDRIIHLHPLRFLMTIFIDEELKAGAHAIRDRGGFIWSGFLDGVSKTASEETSKNNMKVEFIEDFARKVKIDPGLIIEPIQQSKWKELVNLLIDKIPRAQDPNRYDM